MDLKLEKALSYLMFKYQILIEYVGTIFPGENSLISEINISNLNFNLSDKVIINSDSTLLKKGFPRFG